MKITVSKISGLALANQCAASTSGKACNVSAKAWFKSEHSPIRAFQYLIELDGVPSFVSVHLVRHKLGVEHFVRSMRDDLSGIDSREVNRLTPLHHTMLINAASLIAMSRKRLCFKSHRLTVGAMTKTRSAIGEVEPDLPDFLVPECVYRNGVCPEFSECAPGLKAVMKAYEKELTARKR